MSTPAASRLGPDELMQHAAFLTRLARAMTAGRDEADDLVQDAYLVALRHPPDVERPARPWFAKVVRNLVRMRRRGEARLRMRESAWHGQSDTSAAPTPEQLYERALAHRALAEQVVLLAEPFRRTLLLRYVEGIGTDRVAELEGVAPATIRWRVKEGLERLREGMRASAGGRGSWMPALAIAPGGAALGHMDSIARGALIMKTKSKVALVLALLAAAGGVAGVASHLASRDTRRAGAAPRAAHAVTAPAQAPAPAHLASAPEPTAAVQPPDARPLALVAARAEVDPAAARGAIDGRVMNWSTAGPVAGAEVLLSGADGSSTSIATDPGGRFHFEPDRAGRVLIAAITSPGYLPFAPEWGYSPIELWARPGIRVSDVVIYLIPAVDYAGLVVAPDGTTPVAGAEVRIIDLPAAEQELVSIPDRFVTDRKGEFQFHAPDFALLEARGRGFAPGRGRLDGAAATTHRLTLRLAAAGGRADNLGSAGVTGVVVDGSGEPLPGVVVRAARRLARPPRRVDPDVDLAAGGRAVTAGDGRFAIEGLDPGEYTVEAQGGLRSPAQTAVTLGPHERAQARLVLVDGAVLSGVVRDATGQPVPAFTLLAFEAEPLGRGVAVATRTVVDRDGAFSIEGLEARTYRLQATAQGHAPSRPVDGSAVMPAARPTPVTIQLPAGGTLGGVVRSEGGGPLENARVTVEGALGEGPTPVPFSASAVTDRSGQFTLRGLAPGRRSVVVVAYGHHGTVLSGLEVFEGAQLGPLDVVLTPLAEGEAPTMEMAGIGLAMSAGESALLITRVLAGGGAEAAGLAVGDQVVSIDGRSAVELGFEDAIQAIRGPVGTTVRLGVRRAASPDAVVEIAVRRVKIRY